MNTAEMLKKRVLALQPNDFEDLALAIFKYQATANRVYAMYIQHLGIQIDSIDSVQKIPFLPIEFFKTQTVISGEAVPQITFESSGTTGQNTSCHAVADPVFYLQLSQQIFEKFYGSLQNYHILALLPSYLERKNSSLVYMMEHFIRESNSKFSGFYLDDTQTLVQTLRSIWKDGRREYGDGSTETEDRNPKTGRWEYGDWRRDSANLQANIFPTSLLSTPVSPSSVSVLPSSVSGLRSPASVLLVGVTFALLDLAESGIDLSFLKNIHLIIMETGGMKGRRKELLREEVHEILTEAFGVKTIHSEYGMTELLSQGYSKGEGIFELPVSMKILLREINDPFSLLTQTNKTGGINVIDLGNVDSCAFIETKDLGMYLSDNQGIRIIGRFDNADIRGCNLMVV